MGLKKRTFWKAFFVIALLFIALAAKNIAASDNILLNPDFEDVPTGQEPVFPPWWEWKYAANEGAATGGEVTDEAFHSGKKSAARYVKGAAVGCYAQTITVSPGETVEAGIWIKTSKDFSGAQAYLRIEFKDRDNAIIQVVESRKAISADEPWKLYSIETSPAPDRITTAVFCLFLKGKDKNSHGKAWFDDGYVRIKIKGLT